MSRAAIFFLMFAAPLLGLALAVLGAISIAANLTGWFLLAVGVVNFLGFALTGLFQRSRFRLSRVGGPIVRQETGDRSYWMIIPGMLAVFFLPPIEYLWLEPLLPRQMWSQVVGLCLALLGTGLFIWSMRSLRSHYSGHIMVRENQPLVQHGAYRYIRHPAYAGFLLMGLGVSLGYASAAGLAALPVLLVPGLVYRMRVEDSYLEACFGEEFRQYAARTARLIPGVW